MEIEFEEFEGRVHLQGIVDWQCRPSVTTIRFEELEGRVHLQGIVDWQCRPSVTTISFEEFESRVQLQGILRLPSSAALFAVCGVNDSPAEDPSLSPDVQWVASKSFLPVRHSSRIEYQVRPAARASRPSSKVSPGPSSGCYWTGPLPGGPRRRASRRSLPFCRVEVSVFCRGSLQPMCAVILSVRCFQLVGPDPLGG